MRKVLIVDDEESVRTSLQLLLKSNFQVETAQDGREALEKMPKLQPDIVLLDLMMPKLDGIETLRQLKETGNAPPTIMLTAANTVRSAVEAMKLGAVDYISKPFDVDELISLILQTLDRGPIQETVTVSVGADRPKAEMVGGSPVMAELFSQIAQVAACETTVLVTGESGTGKELVARRIHDLSARGEKPFVAINCAAIPESLIESELFGHEKGAFTHAIERRVGHFELADGGTLFLDEIGELSLPVQVKMLRFLQEHEFFRVGCSTPTRVNVRVVAATNRNLEELIRLGRFRQDLYFRVNVINIELPPLRDRYEDIPEFIHYFEKKFGPGYGGRVLEFQEGALRVLQEYEWPGNVRELENVIESLLALAPRDIIEERDLPSKLRLRLGDSPSPRAVFEGSMTFEQAEQQFEREMILKALKKTHFVQTRAAELLGISRRILKYKMDKLGLTDELNAQGASAATSEEEEGEVAVE